jgi:hypothetical protein
VPYSLSLEFSIWLTLDGPQNFCELEVYEKACCEQNAKPKSGLVPESFLLRIGHHDVEVHCASVETGKMRVGGCGSEVINIRYIH